MFGRGNPAQTGIFQVAIKGVDWQEALAVAQQSTGKIIVSGTMNFNTGTQWNPDNSQWASNAHFLPYILRLGTNGILDTTFGAGGFANIDFPGVTNLDCEATDVKVLGDDSILIGFVYFTGPVLAGTSAKNGVAKFTANGVLDSSFGTSGVTQITRPGGMYHDICKVGVQSDGKIVLGGSSGIGDGGGGCTIYSLNADGTLNTGWGNTGDFRYAPGLNDGAYGVINFRSLFVQADDKVAIGLIYNANQATQQWGIARCTAVGAVDSGFGTIDGTALINPPTNGSATPYAGFLQTGTKLVIGGWMSYDVSSNGALSLVRVNTSDGSLDATFGSSGIRTAHMGSNAYDQTVSGAVFFDNGGNIVLSGTSGTEGPGTGYHIPNFLFMVARYTAAGAVDTTWDASGVKYFDITGTGAADNQTCYGALCQPDGKYVICGHQGSAINHGAGHTGANTKLWVIRMSSSGVLDKTFGNNFPFSGISPSVTTNATSSIGTTTATANASITPAGDITSWIFQYGKVSGSYTAQTSAVSLGAGGGSQSPTASLTGLTSGATYFGRAMAYAQLGGLTFGAEVTWTQA